MSRLSSIAQRMLTLGNHPARLPNAGPITLGNRSGIDVVYCPHYLSDEFSPGRQYTLPRIRMREGCRIAHTLFQSDELSTIFNHLERYDNDRIVCAPVSGFSFGAYVMRDDKLDGLRETTGMNELASGDVLLAYDPTRSLFMLSRNLPTIVEHELWHVYLDNDFPRLTAAKYELCQSNNNALGLAYAFHHFALRVAAYRQSREAFVARDMQLSAMLSLHDMPAALNRVSLARLFHIYAAVFLEMTCASMALGDHASADHHSTWLTNMYTSELDFMKPGRLERLIESAQVYAQRIASTLVDDEGMVTDDFDAEGLRTITSEMSAFKV